jgi:hypothetical protein
MLSQIANEIGLKIIDPFEPLYAIKSPFLITSVYHLAKSSFCGVIFSNFFILFLNIIYYIEILLTLF